MVYNGLNWKTLIFKLQNFKKNEIKQRKVFVWISASLFYQINLIAI